MIEVPIFTASSSDFTMSMDFGGVTAELRLTWNANGFLYLSVKDQGGQANGIKVVPSFPLLEGRKYRLAVTGDFLLLKTDKTAEWSYEEMGKGWRLFWVSDEELKQWRVANGLE